jgi:hypothetical protein
MSQYLHKIFTISVFTRNEVLNVTLTFDIDFRLDHPVHGGVWVREPYTARAK